MNTLSSLLNWLGNLIGASPSTLVTNDKTVVGAINETYTTAVKRAVLSAPISGSTTITMPNSVRGKLWAIGAGTNQKGLWIYSVNASGGVNIVEVKGASQITLTTATNSLTVANSSTSTSVSLIFEQHSGTLPTSD